jgi:hydroxyacylglutathione hydrolase
MTLEDGLKTETLMTETLPMKLAVVPVTPFQQNASILWCTSTMKAAIIDPGGDIDLLQQAIAELKVTPEKILITHGHLDHVGGAEDLAKILNVPIEGPHKADEPLIANVPASAVKFGIPGLKSYTPDRWLADGDTVTIGDLTLDVLHVPGHAPGHVVFVHEPSRFAVVGDTVFQGSVGRTDLPFADHDQLITAIKTKLFPLGDDMTILPGHGGMTTIGHERKTNPFLA